MITVFHLLLNLIVKEAGAYRNEVIYVYKYVDPCQEDYKFQRYVWASKEAVAQMCSVKKVF